MAAFDEDLTRMDKRMDGSMNTLIDRIRYVFQIDSFWVELGRFIPESVTLLKHIEADKAFRQIKLMFDPSLKGPGHVDTSTVSGEVRLPVVHIGFYSILKKAAEFSQYGEVTEEMLYRKFLSIVNHELLHAADWCYQVAAAGKMWRKVNPRGGDDPDRSKYFNRDTELKSYASTVALAVYEQMEYQGLKPEEITKMTSKQFWAAVNEDRFSRTLILPKIYPENRQPFMDRVVRLIKHMAREDQLLSEEPPLTIPDPMT